MPPYREPGDDGSGALAARMRAEAREIEEFRKRVGHARLVRFLAFCDTATKTPAGMAFTSLATLMAAVAGGCVMVLTLAEASHFVDRFVLLAPIVLGIGVAAIILVAREARRPVATAR